MKKFKFLLKLDPINFLLALIEINANKLVSDKLEIKESAQLEREINFYQYLIEVKSHQDELGKIASC